MVRGEEVWRREMERWEGQRADADEDGGDEEAPAAGGDALDNGPDNPLTEGDPSLDLTGGQDDPPRRGATGGGGDNRQGGGERVTIGGRRWESSALDG